MLTCGLIGALLGYLVLHPILQLTQKTASVESFSRFIELTYSTKLFEAYYFTALGFLTGLSFGYLIYQNHKISLLSVIDELTGLYNRRYFNKRLSEEVERALRYKAPLSLLVVDVDHFKKYNDNHGHAQGDQLLIKLAKLMRKAFRRTDIVCRYSGEEFTVIVPETNKTEAKILAEKFRKIVQDYKFKYRTTQPKRKVTVSIGVADVPTHAVAPKALFEKADQALYEAKKIGRNRIVVSDSGIIPKK